MISLINLDYPRLNLVNSVYYILNSGCHNDFSLDLDDHKNKWSRHRSFLYGRDRSPGMHVFKLRTEIPNQERHYWSTTKVRDSKFGSTITCEEGLAPSRRPFGNGTNQTHIIFLIQKSMLLPIYFNQMDVQNLLRISGLNDLSP